MIITVHIDGLVFESIKMEPETDVESEGVAEVEADKFRETINLLENLQVKLEGNKFLVLNKAALDRAIIIIG